MSPGPRGSPEGHRIKRKPVPNSNQANGVVNARQDAKNLDIADSSYLKPPGVLSRPGSPLSSRPLLTSRGSRITVPDADLHQSPNRSGTLSPSPGIQRAVTDTPPELSAQSSSPSAVQKAYGEARHFLGGLINHPSESNRHFSILRHSYGIVFYGVALRQLPFQFSQMPPCRLTAPSGSKAEDGRARLACAPRHSSDYMMTGSTSLLRLLSMWTRSIRPMNGPGRAISPNFTRKRRPKSVTHTIYGRR